MLSDMGRRQMVRGGNEGSFDDNLEKEIGMLLRKQEADDRERELNIYRSGSAPPTVEGSLSAVGGLYGSSTGFSDFAAITNADNGTAVSEEDLRSDPAYLSYYYSNVNLNPRLPPPLLSKEDWRFAQRLQGGSSTVGGIGDRRKVNKPEVANGPGRSMFSMPPGFNSKKEEREVESSDKGVASADWGKDGLIGLPGIGLGSKQRSFGEMFQDDMGHSNPSSRHPSRPASRNTFDENIDSLSGAEAELANLRKDVSDSQGLPTTQKLGAPAPSYSYAAALGASLSRSTTPDPQHVVPRTPSPCPTPIGGGRTGASERRNMTTENLYGGLPLGMNDSANLAAALSGLNLSANGGVNGEIMKSSQIGHDASEPNYVLNQHGNHDHYKHSYKKSDSGRFGAHLMPSHYSGPDLRSAHAERLKPSSNSYTKGSSASTMNGGGLSPHFSPVDGTNYGLGGYPLNSAPLSPMVASQLGNLNLPPLLENVAAASALGYGMDSLGIDIQSLTAASDPQTFGRIGNQMVGNAVQGPYMDPMYLQYLRSSDYASQLAALGDQSPDRSYLKNAYVDSLQKAYMGSVLSSQKSQYSAPYGNKSSGSNRGYYGNHAFGVGMGYHGSPLASPIIPNSPVGPGSPMRHNDFHLRFPSSARNVGGGGMGPWHMDGGYAASLLEEFKSNKTRNFELSEIAGHVVDFSADQYGSRFIQQKLETASIEEKNMVFQEINPDAVGLMTDVFGNYVIQKFFEHGMPAQRRELASKLEGNVLALSLQMYGCRVIQKAIEVVDLDQKIKMVKELDGHIMRCVRDQNGNHVIQKCIECVPEEAIQFIIESFFDQVVSLSMHPYGCRVIQRVLEHCKDPNTQSKVMDEILGSVSKLAQDQYGNYVVQHVLEHGKPHERSAIIKELAGKIVQMSQQKFASNVVEKCLTFGDVEERELMVNEMLGTTDENEPLQAMMKDQFANYVVQKVLETCSDEQRELIMTRIKIHLNALKKYTYGKHIVARVEKLLAAGERRAAGLPPGPSSA